MEFFEFFFCGLEAYLNFGIAGSFKLKFKFVFLQDSAFNDKMANVVFREIQYRFLHRQASQTVAVLRNKGHL